MSEPKTIEQFNLTCKESITVLDGLAINHDTINPNMVIVGGTVPIGLPNGSTLDRPLSPPFPIIRYNLDDDLFEMYNPLNGNWVQYTANQNSGPKAFFIKKDNGYIAGDKTQSSVGTNSIALMSGVDGSNDYVGNHSYIISADSQSKGDNNIVIGSDITTYNSVVKNNSISIGTSLSYGEGNINIGDMSITSSSYTTLIGYFAESWGDNCVVIGKIINPYVKGYTVIGSQESSFSIADTAHLFISITGGVEDTYPNLKDGEFCFETVINHSGNDIIRIVARIDGELYSKEIELEAF